MEETDQAVDISEMTPADWQRVHEAVGQFYALRAVEETRVWATNCWLFGEMPAMKGQKDIVLLK